MTPEDIENNQFTKVHFRIYSADRVNAHNYTCSLKVLKRYAKTIAGKPILVWYNKYANGGKGDFAGHENSSYAQEYPVGFFPNELKITYEKSDDGTIYLCADGYIWNIYYSEIVRVFEEYGGIKGVSCEMLIIDSELIEDTGIENILQYSFAGLTLIGDCDALGYPIKPAVDGCKGTLVTNSLMSKEYEKAKQEFEKVLYNTVNQESVNSDSFFNNQNKEETMEKENIKNSTSPDVADNATQEVTTKVEVSTDTYSYDDNGHFVGATHEEHKVASTEINDVPEETVNNGLSTNASDEKGESDNTISENTSACKESNTSKEEVEVTENTSEVSVEEFKMLKQKCSSLEAELKVQKNDYQILMQKCSKLEEFKLNKESENVKNSTELALNSVSHILSQSDISNWRKEAENCTVETVDDFTNRLKAFAFDIQEKNGIECNDSMRNSIPVKENSEPLDIWERIEKNFN